MLFIVLILFAKTSFLVPFLAESVLILVRQHTDYPLQIWILLQIVVGVKVLQNQETTKAIRFIYNLSIS
jgi:hypothetical protein